MITSWKYKDRVFRYITEEQLPEVVDLLHKPEVEKYLWFAPITIEGFKAYCMPIIEGQQKALSNGEHPVSAVFTVSENSKLLGICGISEIPDGHNIAMVGYQLTPSAWGKGVGTCCAQFLVHYAKSYLKVRKLFGDCVTENTASIKILEKCGFSFEGVIKEKYELNGKLHDNSWFGLRMEDVTALHQNEVQEINT